MMDQVQRGISEQVHSGTTRSRDRRRQRQRRHYQLKSRCRCIVRDNEGSGQMSEVQGPTTPGRPRSTGSGRRKALIPKFKRGHLTCPGSDTSIGARFSACFDPVILTGRGWYAIPVSVSSSPRMSRRLVDGRVHFNSGSLAGATSSVDGCPRGSGVRRAVAFSFGC